VKQVLLIEDNWSDARTVERALRRLDPAPRLAIASSADEARSLLRETPDWDLVILDLHVGGDRGIDLLVSIREQYDRNELPVVILSGSDFGESIKEAYSLGASAYLLKKTDYGLQVDQLLATYRFWTEVALHLPATG
jgi:CheY-like chemotaxis protein